jgi:hypothetical protein
MRNDARPIGEDLPRSPISADDDQQPEHGDARESVTHDRQSHVVNKGAEDRVDHGQSEDADEID